MAAAITPDDSTTDAPTMQPTMDAIKDKGEEVMKEIEHEVDEVIEVLASAPPPTHAIVTMSLISSYFLYRIPSLASIDRDATIATFTHRVFPKLISLTTLACIRALIAASIFSVSLYVAFSKNGRWDQVTTYLPQSKLRRATNRIEGIKTLYPFTSWSWNLLGLAFTLSAYVAFRATTPGKISPWTLRLALLVWETAAPLTTLVAVTVRYVIWPNVIKDGADTLNLRKWRNVMMHNMNVVFALSETALLGGLPVRAAHVSLAPLFGILYVIFAWMMSIHINKDPMAGPQFLYFFMDTTLPGPFVSLAMLALLAVLLVVYVVFCTAQPVLRTAEYKLFGAIEANDDASLIVRTLFVALVSSCVMRFRD